MPPPNETPDAVLTEERLKDQKRVADFLAAPRRKRRSYVVTALTQQSASEFRTSIEHFVRVNFKGLAVAHCHNLEELKKAFGRQVVMVIYDDEFTDLQSGLHLIGNLKRKKSSVPSSVIFLTRQSANLISSYNQLLLPYHEADDYFELEKAESAILFSKIKSGLGQQSRRRSRRYQVDVAMNFYALSDDTSFPGRMTDLSVHGAMISSDSDRLFREGEQLKLSIPCGQYLNPTKGDFLKLSARVRRVKIGGTNAGVSFEHVSEQQLLKLTKFLSALVNEQISKAVMTQKLKSVK